MAAVSGVIWKTPPPAAPTRRHQADNLFPRPQAGRHRSVVAGHVHAVTGGGQSGRPGRHGLGHHPGHRVDLVVGRLVLVGPLAHHPGAHGRMADAGGVVDRLGHGVDGVEVLGERLEVPVDAGRHGGRGNVLGPFDAAHHQIPGPWPATGPG